MKLDYFTIPELPGRTMFRCDKQSATMQPANCARLWSEANKPRSQLVSSPCRNCSIGAHHSGINNASESPLTGQTICARCERTGRRMVGNHICVSCWNREREYQKGRNRRGVPPKFHPALFEMATRILVNGEVKRVSLKAAASLKELVISCVRDNRTKVIFAHSRGMNGPV